MYKQFCLFLSILFVLILTEKCLCEQQTLVHSVQGQMLGKIMKTVSGKSYYYSFKGIPYAKPPVDDLKYMPPVEHEGWSGIFNAFNHGNYCVQSYDFSDDATGSEDCLFINVYTPKIKKHFKENDKPYPVMFFVHGGDFRFGSGNTTFFGPDYFMDEKVILVTFNYRLNAFGFLDMENDVITGNQGLKDSFMALKWVKKNIAVFGGDDENITIFGQGDGAMIVDIFYLSPVVRGYFEKAILQSGTALHSALFDWKPKERAYNLTKFLKDEAFDDKSVLKVLKEADPLQIPGNIMRTVHPDETIFKQISFKIFSPTLNNKSEIVFLSKLPEDILAEKDLPNKDVPIMIGFNSQEPIYEHRFFVIRPEFIKNLNKRFPFTLPLRGIHAEFDSDAWHSLKYRILWFYFDLDVNITKDSILNDYLSYYNDITFIPLDQSVKAYTTLNTAPVYYYKFDYIGDLNYFRIKASKSPFPSFYPLDGASEKDELCYLFKCNIMKSKYEKLHASENEDIEDKIEGEIGIHKNENKDLKTLRKMIRLWTNFAKTGSPTPADDEVLEGLEWKPVNVGEINYLHISDEFKMGTDPNLKNVQFWQAMYEYYTPLAVNGILKDIPLDEQSTDNEQVPDSTESEDESNSKPIDEEIPRTGLEDTELKDEL